MTRKSFGSALGSAYPHVKRTSSFCILAVLLIFCADAMAAAPVDVLNVDLAPLIDKSASKRERFAVNVPLVASAATHGQWTKGGSTSQWTWQVRVPTAVSLSFHAPQVRMPQSARLTVAGRKDTATYVAEDVRRGDLWGRPLLGDTLTFTLTVNANQASQVQLEISSLQAGYRGLSREVPDHAHYKSLQAKTNSLSATCTQNYACNATDANRGPAQATVAVLIGNVALCTGTLLNNTRADGRPYVLTARHCQTGELAGGDPGIASAVTIYWESVSPCGEILGTFYSHTTMTQSGARTLVEQQDAWLIELEQAPRIAQPFFAGWDATGNVFTGGYSVHHALGGSKQYTEWFGQPILQRIPGNTVQAPYELDFWGVVNSLGNVGSGASGGALFDPSHRVVGSASLAYINDAGDGMCPVAQPPAPSPSTITAQYTALTGVWSSHRDDSSTTGNVTIQSVLDPDGTGQLTLDGFGVMPVSLTASNEYPRTDGSPITLTWNVSWAQSCTASGGRAGDGWGGTRPASGSAQVMDYDGGSVNYTLTCASPTLHGSATKTVYWTYITPLLTLHGPSWKVMLGSNIDLTWDGSVEPCTASDGLAGDGWAGNKPQNSGQTLVATQVGITTYTLSCGTGQRIATAQLNVEVVAPSVTMYADATRVLIGSNVTVGWRSPAQDGRCDGTGGTPGWAQNTVWRQPNDWTYATSDVPGVFTFTMTCSGGGLTSSSSVTVEFVDEPPMISLTAVSPQQTVHTGIGTPPNAPANLIWASNMSPCSLISMGPYGMGNKMVDLQGHHPSGTAVASEHIAGTYEYVLGCGNGVARATIEWVATPPTITISDSEHTGGNWIAGRQYSVASTTNALPCTATGGAPGDGWASAQDIAPNNSINVTAPRTPGTYTYTLTCGSGVSVGTQHYVVTIGNPAVTLNSTPASPAAGQYVTLAWNANTEPCTANADGAGVAWGGANMNGSSSTINTQTVPGTYTYTITCGSGAQTAHASTQVTFRSGPSTTLEASATSAPVNTPVTLTWVTGSTNCSGVGGVPGDGWSGSQPINGTLIVTSAIPQTIGYALNCDRGSATVQVTYTGVAAAPPAVPRPSTTLSANHVTRAVGESVTLSWTSQNANDCSASGGVSGDGWAGSVSLSGSMSVTRSTAGATIYSITCTGATPASTSETTVTYATSTGGGGTGGSGGGGGGGGGGRLDFLLLAALASMMLLTVTQRQRSVLRR